MKFIVNINTIAIIDIPEDDGIFNDAVDGETSFAEIDERIINRAREYYEQEISGSMVVNEHEVNTVTVFKLPETPAIVTSEDLENL